MIFEDEEDINQDLSHKNYKEYKKELETGKKPNENLIIFISVFFVMLLFFLALAKHLSPDVDVNISDNSKEDQQETYDNEEKGNIDTRLKDLQMENTTGKTADETFTQELEEKVVLPVKERKTIGEEKSETETNESVIKTKTEQKVDKPTPTPTQTQPVNIKVVVGYYTSVEQAEVAKGIIEDAGLNLHPFIKNVGTAYTLQVGSFNTREKAQNVVSELLRNNFPARILTE